METSKIRKLYDRYERRDFSLPGYTCEKTEFVTRMIDSTGGRSFVSFSKLNTNNADSIINDEVRYFSKKAKSFEWKLYDYDEPVDLKEKLLSHGFNIGADEAIMVLESENKTPPLKKNSDISVAKVDNFDRLRDVGIVHTEVWKEDFEPYFQRMKHQLQSDASFLSVYVAYDENKPVCSAWINFPRESKFASLWGGSTIEGYRNRGIYSTLLSIRLNEARQRGYSFVTIDASPMSRPIVEKLGFRLLAISNPCVWGIDTAGEVKTSG